MLGATREKEVAPVWVWRNPALDGLTYEYAVQAPLLRTTARDQLPFILRINKRDTRGGYRGYAIDSGLEQNDPLESRTLLVKSRHDSWQSEISYRENSASATGQYQ